MMEPRSRYVALRHRGPSHCSCSVQVITVLRFLIGLVSQYVPVYPQISTRFLAGITGWYVVYPIPIVAYGFILNKTQYDYHDIRRCVVEILYLGNPPLELQNVTLISIVLRSHPLRDAYLRIIPLE